MFVLLCFLAQAAIATANVGFQAPVAVVELSSRDPLYALEGITLNVYFRNVVRYEGVWSDVTNIVACSKGSSDGTKWTYTPAAADAGTTPFTLTVKDKATSLQITTKTVNLVTRPSAYPASPVSRNVLIIGDSTTAGGQVTSELIRLSTGDGAYALTEAGANTGNANDSLGASHAVAMEAISGADFARFATNYTLAWNTLGGAGRTGSDFIESTTHNFDFNFFLTNWTQTVSAGDWVLFNLGINSIITATTDASLNTSIATELGYLHQMITNITATVPGVRVGVCVTIPPNQSIAAFQSDYGAGTAWIYRNLRNHQIWVERLIADIESRSDSVLVPIHVNIDSSGDMANGVHPSSSGYWKIAASYWMFLKGVE